MTLISATMQFVVCLSIAAWAAPAATGPKADSNMELAVLTVELQKTPDDSALREKIIKLAHGMNPPPAVPKAAKRPFVKGTTYQKDATSTADFEAAISSYREALALAPWWPEAYYNLALAQESAEKFDDAMQSLKLYLLTGPKDAEDAETRMFAMEAKKEKSAREASAQTQAARQKDKEAAFLRDLEGARFISREYTDIWKRDWTIVVRNGMAIWAQEMIWENPRHKVAGEASFLGYTENCRGPVVGKTFKCSYGNSRDMIEFIGHFSDDGRSLRPMILDGGKEIQGSAFGNQKSYERY